MEPNSIVILSLTAPKEKIWGQLVRLDSAGVTLRGIDLFSFDDFVRQILDQEEGTVGMAMAFYPMHRVERIAADEPSGNLPSLADRFRAKVRVTLQEYLGLEPTRPRTAAVPPLGGTRDLRSFLRGVKEKAEMEAIAEALERSKWNRKEAARLLDMSYKAILYKIRHYKLEKMRVRPIFPRGVTP